VDSDVVHAITGNTTLKYFLVSFFFSSVFRKF